MLLLLVALCDNDCECLYYTLYPCWCSYLSCSAFENHGGGSGYVDYKQLEVDPTHKLSIEIGKYNYVIFHVRIFTFTKWRAKSWPYCCVRVLLLNSIVWIIKHTSGRGGNFGSSGKGTTISYYGGDLLFGVPGGVGGVQLLFRYILRICHIYQYPTRWGEWHKWWQWLQRGWLWRHRRSTRWPASSNLEQMAIETSYQVVTVGRMVGMASIRLSLEVVVWAVGWASTFPSGWCSC